MTLTLEIPLETEQALEETARANGQSAADYAAELLRYAVRVAKPKPGTTSDAMQRAEIAARLAALDQLGQGPDERAAAGLGPLPEEALDRESIYEGRGERQFTPPTNAQSVAHASISVAMTGLDEF